MSGQRQLPANIEAEQSVLGSMFISKRAIDIAKDRLDELDFYSDRHQKLFQVIVDLNNLNIPIDITTVTSELEKRNILFEVGGVDYMSTLTSFVPTAANVEYYIDIVEEKSILRRLIDTATKIITDSYSADSIGDILDDAERQILNVAKRRKSGEFRSITDVLTRTQEEIEMLAASDGSLAGLPTGFDDLDKMLSGLRKNDLIIVAARPAMGKTAFALNIAQNVALNSNQSVAVFNLEMSAEQLAMRLLASTGKVELNKLKNGNMMPKDWDLLNEAISKLSKTKLFIDDSPGIKVSEIRAKCRRLKNSEKGLGLVLIDYLQLISGSGKHGQNRQQEVSEISRMLKTMALELGVPVIALSQLSRQVESREDKRPVMSDLRESGSIEQDADIVSFLYRADYYNKEATPSDHGSVVDVIISKHRSGPTGNVQLAFLKNYQLFGNYREN